MVSITGYIPRPNQFQIGTKTRQKQGKNSSSKADRSEGYPESAIDSWGANCDRFQGPLRRLKCLGGCLDIGECNFTPSGKSRGAKEKEMRASAVEIRRFEGAHVQLGRWERVLRSSLNRHRDENNFSGGEAGGKGSWHGTCEPVLTVFDGLLTNIVQPGWLVLRAFESNWE